MSVEHKVEFTEIHIPEDRCYAPATLYTTECGLGLIKQALEEYYPDPWEVELLNALRSALKEVD